MDYYTGEQVAQLVELVKQNCNCNGAGNKFSSMLYFSARLHVVTGCRIALVEILACPKELESAYYILIPAYFRHHMSLQLFI